MGRISCRQSEERLAAVLHSTSFKHALYWLMRNLLKISRVTAGVNILGFSGVSGMLVRGLESRGRSCGIPHLAKNERDAPNFLQVDETRSTCAPFLKERRMKTREPRSLTGNRGCGHPASVSREDLKKALRGLRPVLITPRTLVRTMGHPSSVDLSGGVGHQDTSVQC